MSQSPPERPIVVALDDDPRILDSLRRLLRDEPFDFLTTEDPREAIHWVSSRRVNLIIVDQRMPEMTGVDVLRAVGEASPSTAWIMLTAYPGDPIIVNSVGDQQLWIFGKPWNDDELKDAVRKKLDA
jgi:DNA-binding NtrC family response regulator